MIELPFGRTTLSVTIPDAILGEVVRPTQVAADVDPEMLIRDALDNPVGSEPIERVVQAGDRVALVVDDITRETPTHLMLPPLLARVASAGVSKNDIRIVIALGTHRPMSNGEILFKLGQEIVAQYEIVNVACHKKDQFVFLGTSSNGIPAWVNRAVVEADVRIGVGSITPHSDAGFSGGGKIILPGVCNNITVDAFHSRGAAVERNLLGEYEGPMRQDLEQFVADRVGLEFILNAVITGEGTLYQCVAGHFVQAHRAGVRFSQEVYGVPVSRRYPAVVVNCPAELDFWACSKGLWMGEPMVSDGGTLILVTPCTEGVTIHPKYPDYIGGDPDELQAELDAGRIEDPNACAAGIQAGRMKRRINFALVSPGLGPDVANRMGFLYYSSVEEALEQVLGKAPEADAVGVMTHCDYTIPRVQP